MTLDPDFPVALSPFESREHKHVPALNHQLHYAVHLSVFDNTVNDLSRR